MIFVRTKNFLITKGKFLPAIWRQSEAQHRHAGDQDAGDDQVEEVVERPTTNLVRHCMYYCQQHICRI